MTQQVYQFDARKFSEHIYSQCLCSKHSEYVSQLFVLTRVIHGLVKFRTWRAPCVMKVYFV